MDDIVTRLRLLNEGTQSTYLMFAEAADEIELLRKDRDSWRDIARKYMPIKYVDEVYLITEEGEKLWDKMQETRNG